MAKKQPTAFVRRYNETIVVSSKQFAESSETYWWLSPNFYEAAKAQLERFKKGARTGYRLSTDGVTQ